MKTKKKLFIAIVFIAITIILYIFFGNNIINSFKSRSINDELKAQLRNIGISYLKTKPNIESFKTFSWDEYFTYFMWSAPTKSIPDFQWYLDNQSSYSVDENGHYVVTWIGKPGCKQDTTKPGGIHYGPNWFDENGGRCYQLWHTRVYLNTKLLPIKVQIDSVGGIS